MKGAWKYKMLAIHTVYLNRWLHSDMKDVSMKDVSFFFNFKFCQKVKEKGCM